MNSFNLSSANKSSDNSLSIKDSITSIEKYCKDLSDELEKKKER